MTTLSPASQKILERVKYVSGGINDTWSNGYELGREEEIARLLPIIESLLRDRERLREALRYAKGQLEHAGYTKNAVPAIEQALALSEDADKELDV